MSITLSTGTVLSVAKTFVPAIGTAATALTQITNANPGVVSATNTLAAGDYVWIKSGWGLIDDRIFRVAASPAPTGSTFALEGFDGSDTTKYAGGVTAAAGSFRKILVWTDLTQVKAMTASGGTQNYADVTSIIDQVERKIPTTRSAIDMNVDVYDDPSLAWYGDVSIADAARSPYGLKVAFPNGSKLVANAYWSLLKVPTMATNEALMTQISLSYAAEPTRYST